MYWSYNGYTSDTDEARITLRYEPLRDRRYVVYAIRKIFDISGRIQRDTNADMLTRYEALKTALATDGGDFAWKFADTTESGESQSNAGAFGGIRVMPLAFPKGDGAEMSTFRHYSFQLEFVVLASGLAGNPIVEIKERFSHLNPTASGGGVFIPQANRAFQYQSTYPSGIHAIQQSGSITCLFGYPPQANIPGPIYTSTPPYLKDLTRIEPVDPSVRVNGVLTEYTVNFSYFFQNSAAMAPLAFPTRNI